DQVLLPVGDPQEAVAVELADVTRPQPAVVAERLARRLLVAPVAGEDVVAVEQDLAVLGDADVAARQRDADRPEAEAAEAVDRGRGALRQAVALEDDDAEGVEELEDLACERGAA